MAILSIQCVSQRSQYRQLADLLRSAIERGEYAAGATLPSEADIAAQFSVSRPTVNNALKILSCERYQRSIATR